MVSINNKDNLELYKDWELCLDFLRTIPEVKRDTVVNYHIYSEIKDTKQLMSVKSFLATQDLDHSHLILWSDYNVEDNSLLNPYKDYIDFRVWNPVEESKGTILEGYSGLTAKDSRHYLMSDLLRLLVLHKYGGVWLDHDMILLRDLSPLLDQEWAYAWGCCINDFSKEGPCNAMMHFFKGSELSSRCLSELRNIPAISNDVFRGQHLLRNVYAQKPFTVFPSTFFNIEWAMNLKSNPLGTLMDKGWFEKTDLSCKTYNNNECFAWHWHAGGGVGFHNAVVKPGSKFDIISKSIDVKLVQRCL